MNEDPEDRSFVDPEGAGDDYEATQRTDPPGGGPDAGINSDSEPSESGDGGTEMIDQPPTPAVSVDEQLDTERIAGLTGTVIDGRYAIEEELEKGGMGVVFKGYHQTLDRAVVIKVIRPEEVESETARARFEREARRACQLEHPNVVTVHDFGYHNELGYLVMEFVDGITVSDYLDEHGPMTFRQFAPVLASILKGLEEAHRNDVVHRDIKCANIM
ncbi:MAG: serine/threonine-protein kinase, partial [Bradymonadaceae bacterium]